MVCKLFTMINHQIWVQQENQMDKPHRFMQKLDNFEQTLLFGARHDVLA